VGKDEWQREGGLESSLYRIYVHSSNYSLYFSRSEACPVGFVGRLESFSASLVVETPWTE